MMRLALVVAGSLLAASPAPPPREVLEALQKGMRLLRERRWDAARAACERALRAAPKDPALRVAVALQYLHTKQAHLAKSAYGLLREATEIQPDNFAANRILGDWYFERHFFRESADRYRRALRANPRDAAALNNMALSLSGLKRFKEAARTAKKAIEASGGATRQRVGLAWIYVDWRKPKEALKALEGIDPSPLKGYGRNLFYRVRAEASFLAGQRDAALKDLTHLSRIAPRYVKGLQLLGLYLQQLGRYAEAEAAFRSAIAVDPKSEEAHYGLGIVLIRLKKVKEGQKELATFRRLSKERQDKRLRDLKMMSEELKDRQQRGWISGMGGR